MLIAVKTRKFETEPTDWFKRGDLLLGFYKAQHRPSRDSARKFRFLHLLSAVKASL